MAITADIVRSWAHPRRVMREMLDDGVREDRNWMFLFVACLLIFVSQWPSLRLAAIADPEMTFEARVGGAMLAWIFLAPLALYLLAPITRIVARLLGGIGNWQTARLALFWSLLVAAPLWLLNGIVGGLIGSGLILNVVGAVAFLIFVVTWFMSMYEAERNGA